MREPELLGYGRDPLASIKGAVTADGEQVIPIDVETPADLDKFSDEASLTD